MSRDRAPRRRSSSCSAARRPSTTCRSCPGRPSPRRSRGRRSPGRAGPHRPRRPVVVAAGRSSARRPARQPPTTTRPRSAPSGPVTVGAALDRLAAARPAPVVVHRPPRPVRRGRHGPGPARGGRPGVHRVRRGRLGDRDGQGHLQAAVPRHRPAGRRLARGPRARAGRAIRPRSATELEAFAAGRADPRLMVKPARLGSSVGMTLVHDPAELDAALDVAFRYDTLALVETYLAGARDLEVSVIGNDPADLELYGPGEIVSGHEFYDYAAKYTAGLSETSTRAEVDRPPAGDDAQDRPRRVPGDRRRGLRPDRLPAGRRVDRAVRDQHDPGVHPDQPLPDDAGRGRLHVRATSASGSSSSRIERHAARRRPPLTPRTCPDERSTRRRAGAARRCPGRRSRPVRRASAGLSPVRAGAALAMLATAAAIYGVGASSAFDYRSHPGHRRASSRTRPSSSRRWRVRARPEPVRAVRPARSVAALERLPTVSSAPGRRSRLPGTLAVTVDERVPVLVWQVGDRRYLADADGTLFGADAGTTRRPMSRSSAGRRRPRVDVGRPRRRASARPGRPRRRDPARRRSSRATSAARPCRSRSASPTRTASCVETRPGSWSAVFGFYTPSLRTTDMIPGQVRLLRSLLTGREATVERVILASETDGTYVPRAAPSPSSARSRRPQAEQVAVRWRTAVAVG